MRASTAHGSRSKFYEEGCRQAGPTKIKLRVKIPRYSALRGLQSFSCVCLALQVLFRASAQVTVGLFDLAFIFISCEVRAQRPRPVSYTHLTLPTIYSV